MPLSAGLLLLLIVSGCANSTGPGPGSAGNFHCDRNGTEQERKAC